ncbi:hypothetical protein FQR65_LT20828 [Abscondita terminalis]|nr:hypothetical protein FQR65_LT20828 [Abscondita terminalis]
MKTISLEAGGGGAVPRWQACPRARRSASQAIVRCAGSMGPCHALDGAFQGFSPPRPVVRMKFEFVPWPNFAQRKCQRAKLQRQLCASSMGPCGQGLHLIQGAVRLAARRRATPMPTVTENLDPTKSGQVAMQMNFIAFFPGIFDRSPGGRREVRFSSPCPRGQAVRAAGWPGHLRSQSTRNKQIWRCSTSSGSPSPASSQRWWDMGGWPRPHSGLLAAGFDKSAPYAPVYRSHEDRQGFLGRAELCAAAARHAEPPAQLRGSGRDAPGGAGTVLKD